MSNASRIRLASLAAIIALVCYKAISSMAVCSMQQQLKATAAPPPATIISFSRQESISTSTSISSTRRPVFYTHARTDRTGSGVIDMLKAHLYAFEHNLTYGGACVLPNGQDLSANQQSHKAMIQALGLDHILPFACPSPKEGNNESSDSDMILSHEHFVRILNPEWIRYIRSQVKYPQRRPSSLNHTAVSEQQRHVAVHIRRGDINFCRRAYKYRYLSNSYYLAILDHYLPKLQSLYGTGSSYQVSIYSERESYENWTDFEEQQQHNNNYTTTLHLDTDLIHDAFFGMMTADVLVLSTSTLSILAAILNPDAQLIISPPNNLIVSRRTPPPNNDLPSLPHNWVIAEQEHQEMRQQVAKLQSTCQSIHRRQQKMRQEQEQQQQHRNNESSHIAV